MFDVINYSLRNHELKEQYCVNYLLEIWILVMVEQTAILQKHKHSIYESTYNNSINSFINYTELIELPLSRYLIRTTFIQSEFFPHISIEVFCEQLNIWGISATLKTSNISTIQKLDEPVLASIEDDNQNNCLVVITQLTENDIVLIHPEKGKCSVDKSRLMLPIKILQLAQNDFDYIKNKFTLIDAEENELKSKYLESFFIVKEFLSDEECNHIIDYTESNDLFTYSKTGVEGKLNKSRTSNSCVFYDTTRSEFLMSLVARAAELVGVPADFIEDIQCVRYSKGQEFKVHYDSYEDTELKRLYTILVYLNDDFTGGETFFSELGLTIKPQKGLAVGFVNLDNNGDIEVFSAHAGMPVSIGVKYALNIWIRNLPVKRAS